MKGISGLLIFAFITAKVVAETGTYEQLLGGFSNKLFKAVAEESGHQLDALISPFSIHAVLSMVYQGSDGTTKELLNRELTQNSVKEPQDLAALYRVVVNDLNSIENVTLKTANRVFVKDNVQLANNFNNVIKSDFLSEVQQLNFNDKAHQAESVNVVNNWVEDQTNDKIKNLLQPTDVDENSRLILVNAIYFKGNWNLKFDAQDTKTEPFYNRGLESGKTNVPIMHRTSNYVFAELPNLDAKLISIPYANNRVSFIVILPNKRDGLKEVETKLVNENLESLLNVGYARTVQLGLPSFIIEGRIDLLHSLKMIGLEQIFDQEKANFSRILANDEQLYVNKVIQKAYIEVNEEGSEAAAATFLGVAVPTSSNYRPPPPEVFQVDHPFLFFIVVKTDIGYEARSRVIFQGRMTSL